VSAPTRPRAPWWITPAGALSLLIPVTLLLTWRLDDAAFRLFYRTGKSVTDSTLLLTAVAALVLAGVATAAAVLAPRARRALIPVPGVVPDRLAAAAQGLFWVTVGGYVLYTGAGIANGLDPAAVVQALITQENYSGDAKQALQGIAGVTSLTQVGIAFVVVATWVLVTRWQRRLAWQLAIVLLLSLVRSFVASERLALVEVAVPAVVIVVLAAGRSRVRARRLAASWAPVVLTPLVFVLFAAFEYSRSWQFFKTRTDESFPVFALIRLVGYYATSYNNGQLHLDHDPFPGRLPLDSIAAFWTAPGIAQLGLYDRLSAPAPAVSQDVLERFGNPEFNNPGGLTTPFVDFGTAGGFLFFVVAGLVIGLLFRGFLEGSPVGTLLYPMVVTGLLDLPRYLYWTQGRVVPAVLALLVVALYVGRPVTRRRAPHLRSAREREAGPAHGVPVGAAP